MDSMPTVACPECETTQEVDIQPDTYFVECERCGNQFRIPRKQRVNKREIQEYTSSVNIRIGYRVEGDALHVGWTVQSAEKGNQYLEKSAVSVDIPDHPPKTYWYVAIFKALQHIGEYKSARIWVKHDQVIDHLSGEMAVTTDDLRSHLAGSILDCVKRDFSAASSPRLIASDTTSAICYSNSVADVL